MPLTVLYAGRLVDVGKVATSALVTRQQLHGNLHFPAPYVTDTYTSIKKKINHSKKYNEWSPLTAQDGHQRNYTVEGTTIFPYKKSLPGSFF